MNRTLAVSLVASVLLGTGALSSRPRVAAQGTTSQWDGVYTAAQADRGEALYASNCAPCHNWDLTGTEIAPALAGSSFGGRWTGKSLAKLFDYTQALMPQNSPGGLTRQQNADILAFVFQSGNAPPGPTELPIDPDRLSQLTYVARTP
jgi:mono/diheme cytochrome c family protein